MWWIIPVAIVIVLAIWLVSTYNSLVSKRLKVKNQWSQVDVQLKMRADLVPNLVNTVSGYAKHEQKTLDQVIAARNRYVAANGTEAKIEASNALSGVLNRLFALAEAYPDLKANTNFLNLQEQLGQIANKIANYRQFYNDCVMMYNETIMRVPSNIVASLFHFQLEAFFQIEEADRNVPPVQF